MRPARIFRWAVRILVLFLTATMSIVSVLGGLSAVNLLANPNNIRVPSGPITDYNLTSGEPYVVIPFNLTNAGYFDLTDLELEFRINNGSESGVVHDGSENYGTITQGETFVNYYNATNLDLDVLIYSSNLFANITVSARYSLNLISFDVNIVNMNVSALLGGV